MEKQKSSLKETIKAKGYIRNPVLVQVIGICPVAAAATSALNGAVLALICTLSLIACEVVASLCLKKASRWVRMGLYPLIGAVVVTPVMYLLEKQETAVFSSLGIYLPLLIMNSLNCVSCEKVAVKSSVKPSFFDAVATSVGYSAVLIAVGIIREISGSGSLFGIDIPFIHGMAGALMPFGGLMAIGILAAIHKNIVSKKYPDKKSVHETKFIVDESRDREATFSYSIKNRFNK